MRIRRWLATFSNEWEWRVVYLDGQHTYPVRYIQAKNLAAVFGGKVEWVKEKP